MALVSLVRSSAWFVAILAGAACAGAAQAQQMSTNSADFNAGWGRYAGSENRPVDVSTRDANGNRLIVNGLIQSGASSYSSQSGGVVFMKENNAKDGFVLDTDDSSLTRSHKYFMHLFEDQLGWEVVKHRLQQNFPKELFGVRMYALRPK